MNEADMYGVVRTIIDTHREAAIRRRKRFQVAAVVLAVIVASGYLNTVSAEPVPAYVGCTLAWDYSVEDQARIGGFGVFRNDTRATTTAPSARSVPCDALGLTIGEAATIKVRAWGIDGGHSPWATLDVIYLDPPVIPAPSRTRTVWEWETAP